MSVKEVLQEIIVENRDLDVGRIVEKEIKKSESSCIAVGKT